MTRAPLQLRCTGGLSTTQQRLEPVLEGLATWSGPLTLGGFLAWLVVNVASGTPSRMLAVGLPAFAFVGLVTFLLTTNLLDEWHASFDLELTITRDHLLIQGRSGSVSVPLHHVERDGRSARALRLHGRRLLLPGHAPVDLEPSALPKVHRWLRDLDTLLADFGDPDDIPRALHRLKRTE